MLRAAVNLTGPDVPSRPGSAGLPEDWRSWLGVVWADDTFRRAVSDAGPDLGRQVRAILDGRPATARRVRRAALATARYAIRYVHRSIRFGLFAGVAPVEFGGATRARFGDRYRVVVRPDPVALDAAIGEWEADG